MMNILNLVKPLVDGPVALWEVFFPPKSSVAESFVNEDACALVRFQAAVEKAFPTMSVHVINGWRPELTAWIAAGEPEITSEPECVALASVTHPLNLRYGVLMASPIHLVRIQAG